MNFIEENIGKHRHVDNGLGCDFSGVRPKAEATK